MTSSRLRNRTDFPEKLDEAKRRIAKCIKTQDKSDVWDDTCIVPGQKWEDEILGKLENADIIVLLLSNDFIRSDYCFTKEMRVALADDKQGECAIVPIVVRACRYDQLELGQLQAILQKGKPVKQNKDRDAAWLEVTKQLDKVIARFYEGKPVQ
jgi:hypothetical protein